MEFVTLRHPDIANPAVVPESAVDHWRANGWVATDDQADDTASAAVIDTWDARATDTDDTDTED